MLCCYDDRFIVTEEEAPEDHRCPVCKDPLQTMPKDRIIYINLYLQDRTCGGHEEGGWWFDSESPAGSMPVYIRDAKLMLAILYKFAEKENRCRRSDISSVASEGRYTVRMEFGEAESSPKERPQYC